MSVILFCNSPFWNSLSGGRRRGKSPLFLLSPSKLQSSAPDTYAYCYMGAYHGLFNRAARFSARFPPGGREQRTPLWHWQGTVLLTEAGTAWFASLSRPTNKKRHWNSSVGWVVKGWLWCQSHSNHQEKKSPQRKKGSSICLLSLASLLKNTNKLPEKQRAFWWGNSFPPCFCLFVENTLISQEALTNATGDQLSQRTLKSNRTHISYFSH